MTPGTRPRLLAKRVSLCEINKAQPSDIYNNSCSPYLERAANFHACSPSSGGAKPNLFCYAASEVAHKPGGADLRLAELAEPDVKLALQVSRHYKSPAATAHILKIEHRRSWRKEPWRHDQTREVLVSPPPTPRPRANAQRGKWFWQWKGCSVQQEIKGANFHWILRCISRYRQNGMKTTRLLIANFCNESSIVLSHHHFSVA